MYHFSKTSLTRLSTCDTRLIMLFAEVIKHYDCTILEGQRSYEKQLQYYRTNKSRTLNSKHVNSPSLAVDVAPYPIDWHDAKRFYHFGGFVQGIAEMLDIPIIWGGDWNNNRNFNDQSFMDLVHFELREVVTA